jgi:hypothetical protein
MIHFVLCTLACGITAACGPSDNPVSGAGGGSAAESPDPMTGDRLVLVIEGTGVTDMGGTASLQVQQAPALGFTAFVPPAGFKLISAFSGEAYLLSDPLTAEQVAALKAIDASTMMAIQADVVASGGDLVTDASGDVRVYTATWRTHGSTVVVMPFRDLGKPINMK